MGAVPSAPGAARPRDLELARDLLRAAGLPVVGVDEHFAAVFQGRGHGTGLLTSVLAEARRAGVDDVFLLTTYAQRFFAAHGFREVPRTTAPAALRSSAELQGACPDSATLMRLELSP